jgi:hypothetical protein
MRQYVRLSFRACGAMTAHRRENKWLETLRLPVLDYRANDGRDIGYSPAADTEGDASAGLQTRAEGG